MRDYRDWSPSRRTLYSDPRRRRYRVDADDDRKIRSAYEDCEALSPNRSLRKIGKVIHVFKCRPISLVFVNNFIT